MTRQPSTTPPHTDLWSLWFSRLMQVVGLAIVVYETVVEHNDRPWLLLVAVGMMLGGIGLRLVVEWAVRRLSP